jgi:hypothetical protein
VVKASRSKPAGMKLSTWGRADPSKLKSAGGIVAAVAAAAAVAVALHELVT